MAFSSNFCPFLLLFAPTFFFNERSGWLQRRYPERSVYYWPQHEKEIYYKAAAIVIENIKELNPDLDYEELVLPRREIVLPTTP